MFDLTDDLSPDTVMMLLSLSCEAIVTDVDTHGTN